MAYKLTDEIRALPVHVSDDKRTIWIPLPRPLWQACGKCDCPSCQGTEAFWDTLAVSPGRSNSWLVHYPTLQTTATREAQ